MMRKGLVPKRKLMMDMNLMMKRGRLLRKSFTKLMSQRHHSHSAAKMTRGGYGIQEYEFSCSNSPAINPVFPYVSKRKHHQYYYFPCINTPESAEDEVEADDEPKAAVFVPNNKTPDYTFNFRKQRSPLLSSPFSVRISNYSSEEDEINNDLNVVSGRQVDDEAEEFIKRFYEQLRVQSRMQLFQYQEMDYQDMLAS
ncbi:hypothetical protein FNV43_RR22426 [Rhamnella rubrinervis]|uniref:Cotton fiber protein n=1 Tax=Rhamnella rubrinervis TaxID=2594499 RepID=A0A8K0GR36_9ROSA|nr:hypothetical protein FNV43_RR22426 [Rhamnella rubrinervis]